jgi:hypothetical protein
MVSDEQLVRAVASPPEDPGALADFPVSVQRYGHTLWRVHPIGYEPWYFGSGARFGLKPKRGTCYLAGDEITAIAETIIKGSRAIDSHDLAGLVIRSMPLIRDFRLANTRDRVCARWGITRELATISDYSVPQLWAERLANAGFQGIMYWPRYDLPDGSVNVALFGRMGERRNWRRGRGVPLTSVGWRRRIEIETGVAVLDVPYASDMEFDVRF